MDAGWATAEDPTTLAIGIDASADAMTEASRRASRPTRHGGLSNALFVAAAAEALPAELDGIADRLVIQLPWGSLLRGALAIDGGVARGIARLVAPAGRVDMLVAAAARDRLAAGVDVAERLENGLADDWRRLGLELLDARPATDEDLAHARSTWAKRLRLHPGQRLGDGERTAHRLLLRPVGADPR